MLPIDRLARELPALVSALARAADGPPEKGAEAATEGRVVELLTDLRGRERPDPVELARAAGEREG